MANCTTSSNIIIHLQLYFWPHSECKANIYSSFRSVFVSTTSWGEYLSPELLNVLNMKCVHQLLAIMSESHTGRLWWAFSLKTAACRYLLLLLLSRAVTLNWNSKLASCKTKALSINVRMLYRVEADMSTSPFFPGFLPYFHPLSCCAPVWLFLLGNPEGTCKACKTK